MTAKARLLVVLSLVLAAWLVPASPALAKGPVDKITLTGPGLAAPVEITDPGSLGGFNPWTREFIDWSRGLVTEPPAKQTYEVSFYLKGQERSSCVEREGQFCLIYVLRYYPDSSGGPGYIYIPGPGEPEYRLNINTIYFMGDSDRWDPNGKWQYATAQWDTLMQRSLGGAEGSELGNARIGGTSMVDVNPPAGDPEGEPPPASLTSDTPDNAGLWALVLSALGLLAGMAGLLWLRLRRSPA